MAMDRESYNENPLRKANIINKIFFWWLKDIVKHGEKSDLELSDIYDTMPEDLSEPLYRTLENAWKKETNSAKLKSMKPNLSRVIVRTYCWAYFKFASLQVLNVIIVMIQPKLLEMIMLYFDSKSEMSILEAYAHASTSIVLMALQISLLRYGCFRLNRLGMQIKVAVSSLIFDKITKLQCFLASDRKSVSAINLLSIDVDRFELLLASITFVLIVPMQILGVIFLVDSYVSLTASLTGVTLMVLLTIPLQTLYYNLASKWRAKQATSTDTRISLMDEIVAGVRVIKMYAWENYFEKLVCQARRLEIKSFLKISYLYSVVLSLQLFSHRISSFVVSVVLFSQHKTIKSEIIFPVRQYLHIFYINLATTFRGVQSITNARVSIKRIEDYLSLPEVQLSVEKIKSLKNSGTISIKNVTAFWDETTEKPTMLNLSIDFVHAKTYAILGETGSGKSSLLKLILGELEPYSGQISVAGEISYMSQEPWLFNASIRENILFGESYEMERYEEIVSACALVDDFNRLPHGDQTPVGDRGTCLSGGQRTRINLARAVYRQADIYLLDEPFAAVDARVAKTLKSQCIDGLLKDKTLILITSSVNHLRQNDHIIYLKSGKIQYQGNFFDFRKNAEYAEISPLHECENIESKVMPNDHMENAIDDEISISRYNGNSTSNQNKEIIAKGKLSKTVFLKYASAGGFVSLFTLLIAQTLPTALMFKFDFDMTAWMEEDNYIFRNQTLKLESNSKVKIQIPMNVIRFVNILVIIVAATILKYILMYRFVYEANRKLHDNMFARLLRTIMRFFEVNPAGRILNRFSEDTGNIDNALTVTLVDLLSTTFYVIGSLLFILFVKWWNIIPIALTILLFVKMSCVYVAAVPKIKRLVGIAKSPVLDFVTSTLAGLTTIRSCKAENFVMKEFASRLDKHTAAHFLILASSMAFALWIEVIVVGLFACVAYICIALKNNGVLGSEAGLALTTIYEIIVMTSYMVRMFVETCAHMINVERILQYTELKSENFADKKPIDQMLESWPSRGHIKFECVNLRYSEESQLALKNLSFTVGPNTKVGIVGRTGAGKSSLITALFRLAAVDGHMFIDNLDTQKVDLFHLRSKISIIPQEPILFSTTLRANLDPLNEFDDAQIWSALDSVGLKKNFSSLDQVIEKAGKNLSLGQRQLLCLARSTLKNNRILVLDEATANVDSATDAQIQETIREKFKHCTVLTIAHRIDTIIDCDKVLVIDHGQLVEYDHPHILLQNRDGHFSKMIEQTGDRMSQQLKAIAQNEYKHVKLQPANK